MSEELSTTDKDVTIHSLATGESYHLTFYRNRKKISENSWSVNEYGILIKKMWEDYLKKEEKPVILGQTLSDEGFVEETLHYIAPNSFSAPNGPVLDHSHESFLYWLKSNSNSI